MNETVIGKAIDFESVMLHGLEKIIDAKKNDNMIASRELQKAGNKLDSAKESVASNILKELDTTSTDKTALEQSKGLLKETCLPIGKKNYFVIAGKIKDERTDTGLPGLSVKISGHVNDQRMEFAETKSDIYGNFTVSIELKDFKDVKSINPVLTFFIWSDPESVIHSEDVEMQIKSGRVGTVILSVSCGLDMVDRLESGKTIHDSVDEVQKTVNERTLNMTEIIASLKNILKINREGIRMFSKELLTSPPDIKTLFEKAREERQEEKKAPALTEPKKGKVLPGKEKKVIDC